MNTHYQIGEFAELGGVSAKTLRFYDEIGLLRPASVDPRTGYRHYLPQQLEELATVLALKNLGVSLSKLRELTGKRGSAAERRNILNELKGTLEQSIQIAARSLNWVNVALAEIDESHKPIAVIVKTPTGSSHRIAKSRTEELCRRVEIRTAPLGCGTP